MELKRERVYARFLSAALCLVLISSSPHAMVLCIGDNGHIALEASDSRCCGSLPWVVPDTSVLTFGENGPSAKDDDCGPCLDIPISSSLAEAIAVRHTTEPDPPVSVSIELEPLLVTHLCFSQFHPDLRFQIQSSYFTPLDATILLI
jgi:hypothetical protein